MSSPEGTEKQGQTNGGPPTLPPNVSIFSPTTPIAAKSVLNGRLFTRLTVSDKSTPSQLADALEDKQRHEVDETFCFCHRNVVLIFDSNAEGKDLQDAHHEHFRAVCLVLKDRDIHLNVAGCIFDASTAMKAGFQFEELSSGSVLAIDIMEGEGSSSDDEEDDSDDGNVGEAGIQQFSTNEDLELM